MPDGLSGPEALWCLLRLQGREGSLAAFREAYPAEGPEDGLCSLDALVPLLAKAGLQARPARIQGGDLPFLQLPTLVRLRDRSWLVLKGRTRSGYLVLGASGPRSLEAPDLAGRLSGEVLDLSPGLPRDGSLWARLRGLLGHHRPVLVTIVAATVALQVLGLVTPALTAVIMNRALPDGARSLLTLVAAGAVLMAAFQAWTGYVRGRALLYFTQRMARSAERGLLEHILALGYPHLRKRTLGAWLQAFGGFTAAREVVVEKTLGVLLDGTLALVLLGVMAFLLPGPAALVAATTLVMAGATVLAGRVEARLQAREVEVGVQEQGYLSELLAGIATVKASGTEAQRLRAWRALFRKGLLLSVRRGRITLWANTGMGLLAKGVEAGVLVWGGLLVVRGALNLGAFLAFLQLATAFMGAVQGLVATCLALIVLGPQLAKASEILALPREPEALPEPASRSPEALVLRGVRFRYRPEGPWVLDGFALEVAAGGKARLTGPSGWGKSTVLRLLAGLEAPDQGDVLVGGKAPREVRHKLLYLPQFVQLQGGSLLENLTVFSGGASREAILRAAAATGLDAFVATLPMGFRTLLPHGGRTLSGGQRQWLALTAAVASGRGVLLLDEPMASLDPVLASRLEAVLASGDWTLVTAGHA